MNTFLSQWREKQRKKQIATPQSAPHNGIDTSMLAAESLHDLGGRLRFEVYSFITQCGWTGATCDEIEQALNMKHQTASARVNELMNGGHIQNSGRKRSTSSGRAAIVWVRAGTL